MKVCLLGNFSNAWQICPNHEYLEATLKQLGHQVERAQEGEIDAQELLDLIKTKKCDLLLVEEGRLKGDHISTKEGQNIIRKLFQEVIDNCPVPTVSWLSNIFFSVGPREIEVSTNPIFKADIVFSTDGGHQKEFEAAGINHHCLRMGIYEPEAYLAKPIYPTKAKIAFIGSLYEHIWPYRKELVDFLASTYGDLFEHVGLRGDLRHDVLNQYVATVPIIVGDSVFSPHYWSNRIYEMLGRGAFLIHPMIPGLEKEFTPGEHFVAYQMRDFEGLKKKIDYYFENGDEREQIRFAGFEHCKKFHTYRHRVEQMFEILKEEKIL